MVLISGFEAERWLRARQSAEPFEASFDLGRTFQTIEPSDDGIPVEGFEARIPWDEVERLARHPHRCARWDESGRLTTVHVHSAQTNRQASLWAVETGAPTMMLAGFPMHRTKGTTPWEDTEAKVKAAKPLVGHVLDTTMGLGYTALAAARTAAKVTTMELDPAVVEIARTNPWSAPLFEAPNVEVRVGDCAELVATLPERSVDVILHDPPTVQLAGDLYSEPFYRELLRVLRPKGRLFHYVGNPDSRQGSTLTRGVVRRLHHAGFRKVRPDASSFGVVAER